jgi:hypothetical protein
LTAGRDFQDVLALIEGGIRERHARRTVSAGWDGQRLLFSELVEHLTTMGEFIVSAGPRDREMCALE